LLVHILEETCEFLTIINSETLTPELFEEFKNVGAGAYSTFEQVKITKNIQTKASPA